MKIPIDQLLEALENEDQYPGFCLACGAEAFNIEPDAQEYLCETCGQRKVYGAEEILFMGEHTEP